MLQGASIFETLQEANLNRRTSPPCSVVVPALLYLFHRKAGTMPEKDFYLLIILSVITAFLVIRIVMARIGRRRQSHRLEREIAEYLRKGRRGKITESGLSQCYENSSSTLVW